MSQALAGAAAPYVANVIKDLTKGNDEANIMAHAVLGAVVAHVNGNSALAGATGAAMGEYIAKQLYPDTARDMLTEEQRQTISLLSTVAAGLAGGGTGDSTADAFAGAQAGKNAVENNATTVVVKEVVKWGAKTCVSNSACRTELTKVSVEVLVSAGFAAETARQVSENLSEAEIDVFASLFTGDPNAAIRYLSQRAVAYAIAAEGNKGTTTILPIPEQDPNGGKLVNPITDQQGGTSLVNPGSGEQGATNTGNTSGVPNTGENTTITPIPEQPDKDDLAYISGSWHQGSFDSSGDSLQKHFEKHGKEVGASDAEQYLRKAEEFAKQLRGARKVTITGATENVTRYYKNGKYIDIASDDRIISFGKQ